MADSSLLAAWSAAMMSWYICVKEGRRGKEKAENDHSHPVGPLHVGLQARSLQSAKRLPRLYLQNQKGCWYTRVFEWNRGDKTSRTDSRGRRCYLSGESIFFGWTVQPDGGDAVFGGHHQAIAFQLLPVCCRGLWAGGLRGSTQPGHQVHVVLSGSFLKTDDFSPVNEQAFWDTSCPTQYTWWQWRSWLDIGTSIPRRLIFMS